MCKYIEYTYSLHLLLLTIKDISAVSGEPKVCSCFWSVKAVVKSHSTIFVCGKSLALFCSSTIVVCGMEQYPCKYATKLLIHLIDAV
jgi:hypothetical protein